MMEKIDLDTDSSVAEVQAELQTERTEASMINNLGRKKMTKKGQNLLYLIPLAVLVISFIGGTFIFQGKTTQTAVEPTPTPAAEDDSLIAVDDSMPKTEVCPLNGALYTEAEKNAWSQRRPLAVMIENTPEARPQSGLSNADIVFELVAEGGITRFMPIFYCDAQKDDVTLAPIRSARTYFINLASGFNLPMYVHVGGANDESTPATHALNQLSQYGWVGENDINQFSVGYPTFVRDYNRIPGVEIATEHTMTTSTEKLWAVADKRGWTNMSPDITVGKKTTEGSDWQDGYTGWNFVDGASNGSTQTVAYDFWSGYSDYSVTWSYDPSTNLYTRGTGSVAQTDLNNGELIKVSDVIVMFAKETGPLNEVKHMMYDVIGKGDGLLFTNGTAQEITWSKKTRESELEFFDEDGKDLSLTRGKIWISVLPIGNEVSY